MTRGTGQRGRRIKKSESLEIRLTPEEKSDFLGACKQAGLTASDVLRRAMRDFVVRGQSNTSGKRRPVMIAATLITALALATHIGFQAVAESVPTEIDVNFTQVGSDGVRSSQRTRASIDLIIGETVTFYVSEDVDPERELGFAHFFEAPTKPGEHHIRVDLTVQPSPEEGKVAYAAVLRLVGPDGSFVGEPIEPNLLVDVGELAEIGIGFDLPGIHDEMLEISLQPVAE